MQQGLPFLCRSFQTKADAAVQPELCQPKFQCLPRLRDAFYWSIHFFFFFKVYVLCVCCDLEGNQQFLSLVMSEVSGHFFLMDPTIHYSFFCFIVWTNRLVLSLVQCRAVPQNMFWCVYFSSTWAVTGIGGLQFNMLLSQSFKLNSTYPFFLFSFLQGLFKPSYTFFFLHLAHLIALEAIAYLVMRQFGTGWIPYLISLLCSATVQVPICYNLYCTVSFCSQYLLI